MNLEKDIDRRMATSTDIARLVEQNQGIANTIQSLVATMNNHETRITVLEVRLAASSEEVDEIKTNGRETLQVLAAHTRQEDKDRARMLIGIIATLLSVLGGISALLAQHFLK